MRLISSVILSIIQFLLLVIPCFAMNTNFDMEYVTDEQILQERFERYDLKLIEQEPIISNFRCYAVNELGQYALAYDSPEEDLILVYDANQTFLYGFGFDLPGSFYVEFDGENILFYSVRGNIAMCLDKEGNCIAFADILDTWENNSYWNNLGNAKIVTAENSYEAESVFLGFKSIKLGAFSRLTRTNANGEQTILFDNSVDYSIVIVLVALFFPIVFIVLGVRLYPILRKKKDNPASEK